MNAYSTEWIPRKNFERRKELRDMTREELERLRKIEDSLTRLEILFQTHKQAEQEYLPQLKEAAEIITQSKGVINFIKAIVFIITPIIALGALIHNWWKSY